MCSQLGGDEAVELLFSVMLCENMLLLQFALGNSTLSGVILYCPRMLHKFTLIPSALS